jgi:heme-degrading monooxygenase HmoA
MGTTPDGVYRSQVGFHLRAWSEAPGFLRTTAALVLLFRRTPGAVRLQLSARPARRQFVSHSTWSGREAMRVYFRSAEHREAVRTAFTGMCDEYYSVSTGDVLHYCQRCPACQSWARGATPQESCPRCGAALPRRLDPVPAAPVTEPGSEYGGMSPPVTAEENGVGVLTAVAGPLSPATAGRLYRVLNLTPVLWWGAMILAPRARLTRALAESPLPYLVLGLFYTVALLKAMIERGAPDYGSLEDGPRRLLGSDTGLLAGWSHYLAFDLFAGLWIYRQGLSEGRTTRIPLLLTFLAGPLGLLWFLVQRGLRRPV